MSTSNIIINNYDIFFNNLINNMSVLNTNQKALLNSLLEDEKKNDKSLYSPGPYWSYKTKKILYWLKKKGLTNFRGLNSGIGTSYTDNMVLDIRNELGLKGRLLSSITYFPIIEKLYEMQLKITSDHINNFLKKNQNYYENHSRVKYLISKYKIENSTGFGCKKKFIFNNQELSCHYLDVCDRIETISKFRDFTKISTYFEIGGGFGSNVHLLLNNFKNIKKIIYLDMVPNLFVGTEYLRSFYGESVKDYLFFRNKNEIKFSENDKLEIYCIPPWEIKNIHSKIDHFHNSASFQEMPKKVVENYGNFILKLLNKESSISLIIYPGWKKNNTLSPDDINGIFKEKLVLKEFSSLDDKETKLIYLLSK